MWNNTHKKLIKIAMKYVIQQEESQKNVIELTTDWLLKSAFNLNRFSIFLRLSLSNLCSDFMRGTQMCCPNVFSAACSFFQLKIRCSLALHCDLGCVEQVKYILYLSSKKKEEEEATIKKRKKNRTKL